MQKIDELLKRLSEDVSASPPEMTKPDTDDIEQRRASATARLTQKSIDSFSKNLESKNEEAAKKVKKLKDPNTSEDEKGAIKEWFIETYDGYVRARVKKSLLAYSKFVDPDKLEDAVLDFWQPFLFVQKSPAILKYDPAEPFLKYLNAYLNRINDPGYYGVEKEKHKHVRFGGVDRPSGDDDAEKGPLEPRAPEAGGNVAQLSMDEKDIAKDVVKVLERIVKSGNAEGGISPTQAELFMRTYALGRSYSAKEIQDFLKIKYNPSIAIKDMQTKHRTPEKVIALAGLSGERKSIFQKLLYRIEEILKKGEASVRGKEEKLPDLLTLPTAPMVESIIRLVELLKEWNNVNANVERSA